MSIPSLNANVCSEIRRIYHNTATKWSLMTDREWRIWQSVKTPSIRSMHSSVHWYEPDILYSIFTEFRIYIRDSISCGWHKMETGIMEFGMKPDVLTKINDTPNHISLICRTNTRFVLHWTPMTTIYMIVVCYESIVTCLKS